MASNDFDIAEVKINASEAIIGMNVTAKKGMSGLREYLEKMGRYAQKSMLLYTVGELRRKIMGPVNVVRLGPRDFEVTVGARGPARWPLYVHEGTGLYREVNPHVITARHDREEATVISTRRARRPGPTGVMRFKGRDGRVYYRREVLGQRANPFARRAYEKTQIYANAETRRLGQSISEH